MPDQEKDFATWLAEMGHGATNQQATERLRELVQACIETGRKGSITIKVTVETKGKLAEVSAKLSTNKPEPSLPGDVYYTSEDGKLHSEDPRQLKLPAKVLDVSDKTPRIVGGGKVD